MLNHIAIHRVNYHPLKEKHFLIRRAEKNSYRDFNLNRSKNTALWAEKLVHPLEDKWLLNIPL